MNSITVERTGRVYSMASSEFRVTYPDGFEGRLWSPPWHEMTPKEEEAACVKEAERMFAANVHKAGGNPWE